MATSTTNGPAPAPKAKVNHIGLAKDVYKGGKTTLCNGCGHNSITNSLITSLYDMGVDPTNVAKMSGIGCSSKATAYFLGQSHGFNAVHGRMAAITTGSSLANSGLINVGLSGDGDTASIGLGNFLHMVRRNVPMVYIIENNGCYGLTKGQFSATADIGSVLKNGTVNESAPIDCCGLALELGCSYIGRSYSGDVKQVQALIKGALAHRGTAVLDILSPCITFNDHEGSTKSFKFAKNNEEPLHELEFFPFFGDTTIEYEEGESRIVEMPDGSKIKLKKLDKGHDPTDREQAVKLFTQIGAPSEFYTGLIYYNPDSKPLHEQLEMIDEPLATLPQERTRPSNEVFSQIMDTFK